MSDEVKLMPLHIVFDGPPGPEAGRFVECERPDGSSLKAGEWHERGDGYWELRVPARIEATRPTVVTDEVVERVARAIAETTAYDLGYNICKKYARAAIAAMQSQGGE